MPGGLLRRYAMRPKTAGGEETTRSAENEQTRRTRPRSRSQRLGMLILRQGEESDHTVEMRNERLTIGRSGACDLVLDDLAASRVHAIITRDDEAGTYRLQDQDSVNGTFVNRQRIREHVLDDGDEIQIGLTVMAFRQD